MRQHRLSQSTGLAKLVLVTTSYGTRGSAHCKAFRSGLSGRSGQSQKGGGDLRCESVCLT